MDHSKFKTNSIKSQIILVAAMLTVLIFNSFGDTNNKSPIF